MNIEEARRDRNRAARSVLVLVLLLLFALVVAAAWWTDQPGNRGTPTALPPAPGASRSRPVGPAASPGTGTGRHSAPPSGSPTANSPAPGSSSSGSAPGGSTAPIGSGTYHVGIDIAIGDWSTGGLVTIDLGVCWYSVNSKPAVRITVSVGTTTVHLNKGDSFSTDGCQTWHFTS